MRVDRASTQRFNQLDSTEQRSQVQTPPPPKPKPAVDEQSSRFEGTRPGTPPVSLGSPPAATAPTGDTQRAQGEGRPFAVKDFELVVGARAAQATLVAQNQGRVATPQVVLRPGEQGQHVELFQGYLQGFTQQQIPASERGVYGSETQRLVRDFQRANGLPQNGTADEPTLRRMGFLEPPVRMMVESSSRQPSVEDLNFLVSSQLGMGNHDAMKAWLGNALQQQLAGAQGRGDTNGNGRFEFSVEVPRVIYNYAAVEYNRLTGQSLTPGLTPRRQADDGVRQVQPGATSPNVAQPAADTGFGVATPYGNVDVIVRNRTVLTPDTRRTQSLQVLEVRRAGDDQAVAQRINNPRTATPMERAVAEAAGWLHSNATTSSLPGFRPETVQITLGSNGAATLQRWMSNGQDGRLTSLSVYDPTNPAFNGGFREVPPQVLGALPTGRATDLVREGGTEIRLRDPAPGRGTQPFWEASFDQVGENGQTERVTYQFAPGDNALAAVITARPNNQVSYTFTEAYERLPVNKNNLPVPSGSTVTYQDDTATVVNRDRTVTEVYRRDPNNPDNYTLVERTGPGVQRPPQVSPTTPVTPGAPNTGGIEVTQYTRPLPSVLPYTAGGRTVEEIAGYTDANRAQARFRPLQLQFGDGSNRTVELLQSARGGAYNEVYYDRTGVEYLLTPSGNGPNSFRVKTVQPNTALNAESAITEIPEGAFLMPSLGQLTRERMEQLSAQGLKPIAVLGTGFISYDANDQAVPVGFHFQRNADGTTESVNRLESKRIFAGYVVRNGQMEMVDFSKEGYDAMMRRLDELQRDPSVTAINLFAHRAASQPEDLVGVMGATTERAREPRSRSVFVFDSNRQLVGHIVTPPVSLLDTVNVARQVYGDRAAYTLNADGDFYAHTGTVNGNDVSNSRVLNFRNSMIVVRPLQPGEEGFRDTRNGLQRRLDDLGYWWNENVVDNVNDAASAANARAQEALEEAERNARRTWEDIRRRLPF